MVTSQRSPRRSKQGRRQAGLVFNPRRGISARRFTIEGTYCGVVEGSREEASRRLLPGLPERAAQMLPPATPLVVLAPDVAPLPDWLCVAELESTVPVSAGRSDANSRLYVAWFVTDLSRSIDEMVKAMLPLIDWDANAEDYELFF